jgi:hypothetical protein
VTRYFVSVTLPSLLVAFACGFVITFWVTRKIRRYNAERRARRAAQKLYGPYAQYFLGLQDLANQCKTCTIYVGAPNTIPAGK